MCYFFRTLSCLAESKSSSTIARFVCALATSKPTLHTCCMVLVSCPTRLSSIFQHPENRKMKHSNNVLNVISSVTLTGLFFHQRRPCLAEHSILSQASHRKKVMFTHYHMIFFLHINRASTPTFNKPLCKPHIIQNQDGQKAG